MLKDCGYGGAYHDKDISVSMLLENPLDCGLDAAQLVFSVTIRDKRDTTAKLSVEDFTFYLMDEHNLIYNTQKVHGLHSRVQVLQEDDEPVRNPDCLILTDFRHEYLFQDLKIAFYDGRYKQFHIIEINH